MINSKSGDLVNDTIIHLANTTARDNKSINKILNYISLVTNNYIKKLESMLEKCTISCEHSCNCCDNSETLDFHIINLDNIKNIKFELEINHDLYYIYNIIIFSIDSSNSEFIFSINSQNINTIINHMTKFANACTSIDKKYLSTSLNCNKQLDKWIEYYINLYPCKNCNSLTNTQVNNLCLECQQFVLNINHECAICLQSDNFNFIEIKKCKHIFHKNCFINKNIKSCPLCRGDNIHFNTLRKTFLEE